VTFEEKVAVACGDWEAVAHLGTPPLVYGDRATAGIALAAAFDEELAERCGAAAADEARAHGRNVLRGPTVDIARTPLAGRLADGLGEDPWLAARVAAAYVRGVQSRHVIAMVERFVASNSENGGPASNSVVSERALREIYYPPFEAAAAAGAGAVMSARNRVNGVPACESPGLLRTLKEEWGWRGFVAADAAVRDPLAAARAGLDVGGLEPEDFAAGRISPERLDDIVARIMFAIGVLDGRAPGAGGDAAPALEAAIAGTVLLRNDGLLPLAGERSLAVIGPAGAEAAIVARARCELAAALGGRIEEAARLAAGCDAAIVFADQASAAGTDRGSLALPGDLDALIAAVADANPRTAVVLSTGGPVLMPWRDDVAAIVQAWHAGERFGEAIAAVLFGDADPGGRLPVTFPAATPAGVDFPDVDYDEGVLVGYRRFDAHMLEPLFPFGHGLSYGDHRYGEARLARDGDAVDVVLEVENVGTAAGSEVVQLYLAAPPAALAPPLQLKGFRKLRLEPGERAEAAFRLAPRDLAVWDEVAGRWIVHAGRYEALVGRSSRDIRTRIGFERNE